MTQPNQHNTPKMKKKRYSQFHWVCDETGCEIGEGGVQPAFNRDGARQAATVHLRATGHACTIVTESCTRISQEVAVCSGG